MGQCYPVSHSDVSTVPSSRLVCIVLYFAILSTVFGGHSAEASLGDLLATFPFQASDLLIDPTQPYLYATVADGNTLQVINTTTLSVAKSITLPGTPMGAALDGNTLYVADFGNKTIDLIDTQSLTLLRSIPVPTAPYDVAAALNHQLFVLQQDPNLYGQLDQLDVETGISGGPIPLSVLFYSGNLEMSPDKKTLYYAQHGLSASDMYAIDISSSTPTVRYAVSAGENGFQMVLSHDGSSIAQPNGYPYYVSLFRTSNFTPVATFNTGPYPNAIAFSPDDSVAYITPRTISDCD